MTADTAATPSTTQDVAVWTATAHTAIARNTSKPPGSTGTTMPTRPIAMTSATSTVPKVFNYGSSTALP